MKIYLHLIKLLQNVLLGISILIMLTLPLVLAFTPDTVSEETIRKIYDISHVSIFLVMLVRPLADIFLNMSWLRPLVILRKGVGVLSASIAVSFIFSKLIIDPSGYIEALGTGPYWSLQNLALLAHLADLSAVLLLITSNNLSKRLLGVWWKRVQRLSYLYFYASSLYVFFTFGDINLLLSMAIITFVTLIAYGKNRQRKKLSPKTA